jgi:AcrR family transcriptional regulator
MAPRITSARKHASPKKKRERLDLDSRRDAFLATGLAVFSARSYDEVSIGDLAAAAGVSKGLLYHYFPTKRDFYVAALRKAAEQLLDQTKNDDPLDPAADLAHGIVTYLDFAKRHRPAYLALMRGGIGSDPEVAAVTEETRATLATRVLERMPKGSVTPLVRVAVRGWIGFVETTAIDWLTDRRIPKAAIVRLACAVFFDAVAQAGATRLRAV